MPVIIAFLEKLTVFVPVRAQYSCKCGAARYLRDQAGSARRDVTTVAQINASAAAIASQGQGIEAISVFRPTKFPHKSAVGTSD